MKPWFVLALACGCEWPVMSLAERATVDGAAPADANPQRVDADREQDEDDAGDEDVIPCSATMRCDDAERSRCDLARGLCVECLRDEDCPPGERCAEDGECDD